MSDNYLFVFIILNHQDNYYMHMQFLKARSTINSWDTPQNLGNREFGQNFIDHNCNSLKVRFHKIHIPNKFRQLPTTPNKLPTSPDNSQQTPDKSRQAQGTSTDSLWRNVYHKMTLFHAAMAAALMHFFISPKPPTAKL